MYIVPYPCLVPERACSEKRHSNELRCVNDWLLNMIDAGAWDTQLNSFWEELTAPHPTLAGLCGVLLFRGV